MSLIRFSPTARVGHVVNATTGCWEFRGSTRKGYGKLWNPRSKRVEAAHRVYYERAKDVRLPKSLDLDHLCRNRRCVNPEHLEPVTRFVNLIRGANAKLTWDEVRAIRAVYAAGVVTHRELARVYGISNRNCSQITTGRSWRDSSYVPPTVIRRHGTA